MTALRGLAIVCFTLTVLYADDLTNEQYPLLCGNTISKGFQRPKNKQGIHDQRFYDAVRPLLKCLTAQQAKYCTAQDIVTTPTSSYRRFLCPCAGKNAADRCA